MAKKSADDIRDAVVGDSLRNELDTKPLGGEQGGDSKPESGASQSEGATNRIAGFDAVSPFDVSASGSSGARKRGRPPGARNIVKPEEKTPTNLKADIEGLLVSLNLGVAAMLDVKELADIPDEKTAAIAESIRKLAALYNKTMNPKAAAWSQLGVSVASAYGPIVYAVWLRGDTKPPKPIPAPTVINSPAKPNGAPARPSKPLSEMSPSELWSEGG